ncbi:MAG: FAD synthase [Candidatus Bathyarchaeota archaeon]|nr:MAG: FAD synthase [Candidatus Bathyarchaeota archaeon]
MVNADRIEKRTPIVMAAGVFDLLHLGHVRYLEEAKKAGGENAKLIVIVARDRNVEKRKGEKPVMSEKQRRALVESLKVVDEAILGYEEFNMGEVIERIRPTVIALGHDQYSNTIGDEVRRAVAAKNLSIAVARIGKFTEDELDSSSEIKRKIIQLYRRQS